MTWIPGERVVLRDWTAADLPAYRAWQHPRHRWHDTNGPYFGRPSEADGEQAAAKLAERVARPLIELPVPRESLAVAGATGEPMFGVVSWYYESEDTDWRRMGIVLFDPARWGGGNGTEALRLWTSYLFATSNVPRLDFATFSGNPGMVAVGRRLGFVEEGRFRKARRWRGVDYDGIVMGVLREEWPYPLPAGSQT